MPIAEKPANARTELPHLRTLHSKTWDTATGEHVLHIQPQPVHFRHESGELRDIDTSWQRDGDTFFCDTAPYIVRTNTAGIGFDITDRQSGARCNLSLESPVPADVKPRAHGERLIFPNAAPDLDIEFRLLAARFKTFQMLQSAAAPREFAWRVTGDLPAIAMLSDSVFGVDADKQRLDLTVINADGILREVWSGKTIVRDPVTRIPALSDIVSFPVVIDPTFNVAVTAGPDDGYTFRTIGAFRDIGYPYVTVGRASSSSDQVDGGWRFNNVVVPQGATISSATLTLNLDHTTGSAASTFFGYATDNAQGWVSYTRTPSSVTRTTASTALAAQTGSGSRAISVTAIVQEIVNRAGWASGNSLSLIGRGNGSTNRKYNYWSSYDLAPASAGSLSITYSGGGGGGGPDGYPVAFLSNGIGLQ